MLRFEISCSPIFHGSQNTVRLSPGCRVHGPHIQHSSQSVYGLNEIILPQTETDGPSRPHPPPQLLVNFGVFPFCATDTARQIHLLELFDWPGQSMGKESGNSHKPRPLGVPDVEIPENFGIGLVVGPCSSGKTSFITSYFGEPEKVEWDRYYHPRIRPACISARNRS
jgi:hypothetical protein